METAPNLLRDLALPLLYFVRHGQTDWNAEARLQGQADTDINALGRAQAEANGRKLRALIADPQAFDYVASPLRRTRETMEAIRLALGLPEQGYLIDERLVELHFGDWQGFTYAELEARDPGSTLGRRKDKWRFRPPGELGESYQMLSDRVALWLETVTRPTVCVTHGGVIRALFQQAGTSAREAARMNVPQDKVLRYDDGVLEWL